MQNGDRSLAVERGGWNWNACDVVSVMLTSLALINCGGIGVEIQRAVKGSEGLCRIPGCSRDQHTLGSCSILRPSHGPSIIYISARIQSSGPKDRVLHRPKWDAGRAYEYSLLFKTGVSCMTRAWLGNDASRINAETFRKQSTRYESCCCCCCCCPCCCRYTSVKMVLSASASA